MQDILIDMHLAEGVVKDITEELNRDSLSEQYFIMILKKHDISRDEFQKAITQLYKDPSSMEQIYDGVVQHFTKEVRVLENANRSEFDSEEN